jgi:hypothetical protein
MHRTETLRSSSFPSSTIAFIGVLAGPPPAESRISSMVMQQQRLQVVTVGSVEDLQAIGGCDRNQPHEAGDRE